jgi:hypothetical protein
MKTNLIGVAALAAAVLSTGAFAQDYRHPSEPAGYNSPQQVGGYRATNDRRDGQYVTRNVQQWVAGHYEQVYVPFASHGRFHSHGGRMESRWVPGTFITVAQQVWVPSPRGPAFGINIGNGYHRGGQARVGVHIGVR